MADAFRRARVVGAGTTAVARTGIDRSGFSLGLEAMRKAFDDAGLTFADVDAVYSRITDWPPAAGRNDLGVPAEVFWASQLRRPISFTSSRTAWLR